MPLTAARIRNLATEAVNSMGDVFYDADLFEGDIDEEHDEEAEDDPRLKGLSRNERQELHVIDAVEGAILQALAEKREPSAKEVKWGEVREGDRVLVGARWRRVVSLLPDTAGTIMVGYASGRHVSTRIFHGRLSTLAVRADQA